MRAEMRTEAVGDFAYQTLGEDYCHDHNEVPLIWGYSTGKTRVVLTRLVRDPRITTVLYFTRKNNVGPTAREIEKHSSVTLVPLLGSTRRVLNIVERTSRSLRSQRTPCVFLMNYDKAKTIYNELAALWPEAVIVDESTAIKRNSARTRAIYKLGQLPSVVFRCAMTGEMAPQRKEDYWHQFWFVYGENNPLGRSFWAFQRAYFNKVGYDLILKPGARERLLKVVASNSCILKTSDVRIPLRVNERMVKVPLTKQQKTLLAMLGEGVVVWPDRTAWMPTNPAVIFEKRLQVNSGFIQKPKEEPWLGGVQYMDQNPKLEALIVLLTEEMVDHLDPSGPKVVIWARRNIELDQIIAGLQEAKITAVSLRGRNTAKQNDTGMLRMLNDPETRVCVAQADMGFGVNELVTCDTSIWYSNSFSVESRMQAAMRLDRPGQKYRVLNHIDIVCEDGDDEAVALGVGSAEIDCRGFTSRAQIMQAIARKDGKSSGRK